MEMTRARKTFLACAAAVAAGCGQFKMPKATPPEELPVPPRLMAAAPEFVALGRGRATLSPADLRGRPAVLIGFDWRYAVDAKGWQDALAARFGPAGQRYAVAFIVEDSRLGMLEKLDALTAGAMEFYASPAFAAAYGFVDEGPHVAFLDAAGILLARLDGPVNLERWEKACFALQGVLPPAPAAPPEPAAPAAPAPAGG